MVLSRAGAVSKDNPSDKGGKPANEMWGGRFAASPDALMEAINASIGFDQRLWAQDIAGSRAHAEMLAAQKIISADDASAILKGLDTIEEEIKSGSFEFKTAFEDIHMNIEARLKDLIGEAAGRLHTARSRNDQVATDFRLYVRDAIDGLDKDLKAFQDALLTKASAHAATIMPGFTHLQTAQPVTFGHHLLAYVEMASRDRGRFADARKRLNESPLGAAALAGTPYAIDRNVTAKALGFDGPTRNSLDSVSDRDFALETLSAASIAAIHLSRFAEEIVVWMSAGFKFIDLPDSLTTGSSIMPQKRNPDAAELVRAKSGRVIAAFSSLSIVMKGLPLAYSKDMQEDKEALFDALDALSLCLAAMTAMAGSLTANKPAMAKAAGAGFSTATDLADWLVRAANLPFRQAHHVTGTLVAEAEAKGIDLHELTLEDMQKVEPAITKDIYSVLSVESSVKSRTSLGGTSPDNVRAEAQRWRKHLNQA